MCANPNNRFIINQRREKVLILLCQGLNETEIAKELNVGQPTICRDLKSIKKESQKKIESIIEDVLPYEYTKCMLSAEQIIKECWKIFDDTSGQWSGKNRLDALKLIKDTNTTKHEILMQGPLTLRAQQIEEKVGELDEADEIPNRNFMNLGLPALKSQKDEDLR